MQRSLNMSTDFKMMKYFLPIVSQKYIIPKLINSIDSNGIHSTVNVDRECVSQLKRQRVSKKAREKESEQARKEKEKEKEKVNETR